MAKSTHGKRAIQDTKKKQTRVEKAEETRQALFNAAAEVVGRTGYEGASVVEITKLAGVANGTFYNYFETRQELFDQLLPAVGEHLMEHIRASVGHTTGIERERGRITAYFEFFEKNPGFLRILNEAEIFSPQAFKRHVKGFAKRYGEAIRRQQKNGELRDFDDDEIEPLIFILMGARSYLTMLWNLTPAGKRKQLTKTLTSSYLKVISGGVFNSSPEG